VSHFNAPEDTLGQIDAGVADCVIGTFSDVALVIDPRGVIVDQAFGSEELARELEGDWRGLKWSETVMAGSRAAVGELLRDVGARRGNVKWRQVLHPTRQGEAIPVRYAVVPLAGSDRVLAVGRDQQAVAVLQEQLAEAQQALERDYWRLRQMETRYRLLFQTASEAVLIVEAGTQKVVEANPAAVQLLGDRGRVVLGQIFPFGFDEPGTQAVQGLLAAVRSAGRAEEIRARLDGGEREYLVSAALLRQENVTLYLVRLVSVGASAVAPLPETTLKLLKVMELAPDGVVVTGTDGRIVSANAAFLDLVQLASEEQVRGESLDRWLGRPGVDMNVLLANLRQHGTVRLFATVLRGEYGSGTDVEVSAVAVRNGERPGFGFVIRNVRRRIVAETPAGGRELPRSVEQLTELVGRVPLKELVRESTDLIERLCIEAALDLTGDNRASAAELLGLSRQSLYVKLRRYGISDLTAEEEG
jgi:transcriptional regulator PpsR